MKAKKVIALTLIGGAILTSGLVSCAEKQTLDGSAVSQIANPWSIYTTLEAAIKNVGFDIELPEAIDDYKQARYQIEGQEIIEITFLNEENEEIVVRKGTGNKDISGDYNNYSYTSKVTIDEYEVTIKGDDENNIALSIWSYKNYSYALCTPKFNLEKVSSIILQID